MSDKKPNWHVQINGQSYGPYTTANMEAFAKEGRVVASSMITPDPTRGFYAANRFPVFDLWTKPQIEQTPPTPEPQQPEPVQQQVQPRAPQPAPVVQQAQVTPLAPAPTAHPQPHMQAQPQQQQHQQQPLAALQNPVPQQPAQQTPYQTISAVQQSPAPETIAPQTIEPAQSLGTTNPPQTAQQPQVQMRPQAQAVPDVQHDISVFLVMAEIVSGQSMAFLQVLQGHGPAQRIGDNLWIMRGAASAQSLRNALSQTLPRQDRLFSLDSFANQTAWFNIGAEMDAKIRDLWQIQ